MKKTPLLPILIMLLFMVTILPIYCEGTTTSETTTLDTTIPEITIPESTPPNSEEVVIGVSLPTTRPERWDNEKKLMEAYAKERGVTLKIKVADNDAQLQTTQVDELLSEGIDILILAPVDSATSATSVEQAHKLGKKVIAYDRLITNSDVDLYVTFDSTQVGKLQGEYLANQVPSGNYIILSGDQRDYNSKLLKQGAMRYIEPLISSGQISILTEQSVQNWEPTIAYNIVEKVLEISNNKVDAILSPNDSIAEGVVQALQDKGLAGKVPVTGQDADLSALQRIAGGTQAMTVLKDPTTISKEAIDAAINLVEGKEVITNGAINNEKIYVPSILLPTQIVTKDNLDEAINKIGYINKDDVYR